MCWKTIWLEIRLFHFIFTWKWCYLPVSAIYDISVSILLYYAIFCWRTILLELSLSRRLHVNMMLFAHYMIFSTYFSFWSYFLFKDRLFYVISTGKWCYFPKKSNYMIFSLYFSETIIWRYFRPNDCFDRITSFSRYFQGKMMLFADKVPFYDIIVQYITIMLFSVEGLLCKNYNFFTSSSRENYVLCQKSAIIWYSRHISVFGVIFY